LHFLLERLLKGYKNSDPAPKGQKALTPSILCEMSKVNFTPEDVATHECLRGAFFFAMRSCEYLKVEGTERRTKLLRVRNLRFFKGRRLLPYNSLLLHMADCVTVNFEFQKRDDRDEDVTQHRSDDPILCPVRVWATVVRRILAIDGATTECTLNTYANSAGKLCQLSSKTVLAKLRAVVQCMGKDRLGYGPEEIGTHSIRSGAAMAMYLAGVPVYTIMLLGRWSSDAFLRYIRRQVQEFSKGVSRRMITSAEFFTIPEAASAEDPRVSGNTDNFSGRGLNFGLTARSRSLAPAFALHM
jgi:hypothetical protein